MLPFDDPDLWMDNEETTPPFWWDSLNSRWLWRYTSGNVRFSTSVYGLQWGMVPVASNFRVRWEVVEVRSAGSQTANVEIGGQSGSVSEQIDLSQLGSGQFDVQPWQLGSEIQYFGVTGAFPISGENTAGMVTLEFEELETPIIPPSDESPFSAPELWIDESENSPPPAWEALAPDGRWWFSENTFNASLPKMNAVSPITIETSTVVEWEVLQPTPPPGEIPWSQAYVEFGIDGAPIQYEIDMSQLGSGSFELPPGVVTYFSAHRIHPTSGGNYEGVLALRFLEGEAPPEPCILPNMVGMQLEAAESSLEETTFILGDVTEEESEVDEGLVLSQSLSPGEQECGATVNLVVSSGPGGGGFCLECFDVGGQCTSPISSLVSDVLEHVPKASDPQVESVLRDVVIDFLKRTKILHFDHPAISVVEGQSEYPVLNPCGFQVLHIRSATIAGKPIIQTSEEQLDLEWQELSKGFGWRYRFSELPRNCPPEDWRLAESELPGLFYQLSPNDLSLVGIPTVAIASALRLKVVVFPTREVTAIPQWIFNTWHQGIVAGAIGSLKMMPEKPWSDRQAAGAYIDAYNEAVGAAEGSGLRGFRRNDRPHLRTKSWN